jgi:hAT family C-terminal dimerisation region
MAIDIYSIPAMSSEPERVFSSAKHTVSDQRNSLEAETIELLECMKSWFRLGIFTEQDLHLIVGTMEDGAVEAMTFDVD